MCDKHKFILKPPILVVSAKEEISKIKITPKKLHDDIDYRKHTTKLEAFHTKT